MKTISQEQVKHISEKAIFVEDREKIFSIPKSKFLDVEALTIAEDIYEVYASKEVDGIYVKKAGAEPLLEVKSLLEEYNDKSYSVKLMMSCTHEEIGNRERLWFVPKSLVREIKERSFIVPLWCFNNGIINIIEKDINYFVSQDEKFKSLSKRDFDVVTENIII